MFPELLSTPMRHELRLCREWECRLELYCFNHICIQQNPWKCHGPVDSMERGSFDRQSIPQGRVSEKIDVTSNAEPIRVVETILSELRCLYEQEKDRKNLSHIRARHVEKPGYREAWTKTTHGVNYTSTMNNHDAISHK
jgi:hypothetical protein